MAQLGNKVLTAEEAATYSTRESGRVQAGDIMIDTATHTGSGGLGVYYNDIHTRFSTCRTGASIWIDQQYLPKLYMFDLNTGFTTYPSGTLWSSNCDASNPIVVRPLPYTDRVELSLNDSTNTGRTMRLDGVRNWGIDGETDNFPGIKWGLTKFPKDKFGFYINCKDLITKAAATDGVGMCYRSEWGLNEQTAYFRGLYCEHGFAGIRLGSINVGNNFASLLIERCIMGESHSGEGFYLGMTGGSPKPTISELTIQDCLFIFRGLESMQTQNLLKGTKQTYLRNLVLYGSAFQIYDNFGANQDGNFQWMVMEGQAGDLIDSLIIGGGESQMIKFSASGGSPPADEYSTCKNVKFWDGRNFGIVLHTTLAYGVPHSWEEIDFGGYNNTYTQTGQNNILRDYVISQDYGVDNHRWINIRYDDTKANFMDVPDEVTFTKTLVAQDLTLTYPQFVKPGFSESTAIITRWSQGFSHWCTKYGQTRTFVTDEICWDGKDGNFYKSKTNHSATSSSPKDDATNWELLYWDETGKRSDEVGYNSGSRRTDPPYDFRLKANEPDNLKGRGFDNEPNDDYSYITWYINSTNSWDGNQKTIPGEHSYRCDPSRFSQVEAGKYIGFKITPVDQLGNIGTAVKSSWTLIT